jgi:AcrR family transcriptional regulator
MADMAPPTQQNEVRRQAMLKAAAELICERGFGDTRIADVAKRAKASSALVIYYFGTRDRLLVDALRYSEQNFYDAAEKMLAEVPSARERLSLLVSWTCVPVSDADGDVPGYWGLWFDMWAQAFRHPEISRDRIELDARWRTMIVDVVTAGVASGEIGAVDASRFAMTFAALLDGLSIQVALGDPTVDSAQAYRIAMDFAEHELGLPARRRRRTRAPAGAAH